MKYLYDLVRRFGNGEVLSKDELKLLEKNRMIMTSYCRDDGGLIHRLTNEGIQLHRDMTIGPLFEGAV